MYTTDPKFRTAADLRAAVHLGEIILVRVQGTALLKTGDPINGTCGVTVENGEQVSVEVRNGAATRILG